MEKSSSKNKTKKWLLIYYGGEAGTEYIDEDEYKLILKALEAGRPMVGMKDQRLLSTTFQRIVPNPDYVDPVEDERKGHYYFLWNKYQELKQSGAFEERYKTDPLFKFEKWYKENKKQLDKEYANKK